VSPLVSPVKLKTPGSIDYQVFKGFAMRSMFGLYLCIKNGFILDYGTKIQIAQTHAKSMFDFGKTNILIGLFFIVISILK
jgi:hypothetical protein